MSGIKAEIPAEFSAIQCSHSEKFPALLTRLRLSLLISTYQTGHLIVVAAREGELVLTFHQFERPMGLAIKPGTIALCTSKEVWFLRNVPDIAAKLEPRGQYDACFLARTMHFTGDFFAHEAAWVGNEFWMVNTLFSCLSALHPYYSFDPRWQPRFISALTPEDRCHLNGLAVVDDQPRYATALGETDTPKGWRNVKTTGGCLIEIPTGRIVARGLSLPHSPRMERGPVYILQSGLGSLDAVDPSTGEVRTVAVFPGVVRGLALHGGFAFVGLSKARPTLEGVPIVSNRDELQCGLAIVELSTGTIIANLEFHTGVQEVFDIQVLPGISFPYISGPLAEQNSRQPLWTVPPKTSPAFREKFNSR